ncbi:MAG TPA: flagellar basal body-associated FliL family protein [Dyella sp.]|uniref:flagellar basal body-associated FliL family protein n=1 Tax=Dyella sp. TaxID=1869338 RepID=UPI002D79BB3D|nr:flagellar basal body-associated FliL family protein [Dyella sp.]HET6554923.1 flagellar basal body-associated FliL family protein [Dyella sp.]
MAQNEQTTESVGTPARKGFSKVVLVMGVALLGLGGACGFLLLGPRGAHNAGVQEEPKVLLSKQEQYLAMDPPFVVNFKDDQSMRFLQVGVSLMSHDAAALASAKEAEPVIRNALVMLFSSQDYTILSDAAGKQKLQAQALAAVRKIVQDRLGRPGVEALYFTSFVMQ